MKRRKKRRVRRKSRLVRWLVIAAFTMATVYTASWYMHGRAQQAMARQELEKADGWLAWSGWIPARRGRQQFLLGRLARRRADYSSMQTRLDRAAELGVAREEVEQEKLLAMAQQGDMRVLNSGFADLMTDPSVDLPEVCQAYVTGLLTIRRYDAACQILEAWSKDFPRETAPLYLLGSVYQDLDRDSEAEATFREVLKLAPDHYQSALSLGIVLLDQQKLEEAEKYLRFAGQDPGVRLDADIARSECLRTQGKGAEAQAILSELVQQTGDAEASVQLAQLLLEDGEFKLVEELLLPIVQAQPERLNARYALAQALRQLGQAEKAEQEFAAVIEAKRQLAFANQLAETIGVGEESAIQRVQVARIYLKYGSREEGLRWLLGAYAVNKRHKETLEELVSYYRQQVERHPDEEAYRRTLDNFKSLLNQLDR